MIPVPKPFIKIYKKCLLYRKLHLIFKQRIYFDICIKETCSKLKENMEFVTIHSSTGIDGIEFYVNSLETFFIIDFEYTCDAWRQNDIRLKKYSMRLSYLNLKYFKRMPILHPGASVKLNVKKIVKKDFGEDGTLTDYIINVILSELI